MLAKIAFHKLIPSKKIPEMPYVSTPQKGTVVADTLLSVEVFKRLCKKRYGEGKYQAFYWNEKRRKQGETTWIKFLDFTVGKDKVVTRKKSISHDGIKVEVVDF